MRYVKLVPDVGLKTYDGSEIKQEGTDTQAKATFKGFIEGRLREPQFGQDFEWVMAATNIAKAFDIAKEDGVDYLTLEEADWSKLVQVVKSPEKGRGYVPEIVVNLVPFFRAVVDASTDRPAKKAAEEVAPSKN